MAATHATSDSLTERLLISLAQQDGLMKSSLILNPAENIPFEQDLSVTSGLLHGLYNSDKIRSRAEQRATDTQFAGRDTLAADCQAIYAMWADALGAGDATLRLLSGLHAHIVLFMAMATPGQRVLLLPTLAGGHVAGRAILERLGLEVTEMAVDETGQRVDMQTTLARCADHPPDYILVDRSEGLVVEDLSALARLGHATTIFDGSQYLTNIVSGDHPNPFEQGFDLLVASVHKNFPGPQKALLATRVIDERWRAILAQISIFVSNMHVANTYAAALTLARRDWLATYSRRMLDVAVMLELALADLDVPVVRRRSDLPPTHHLWIGEPTRERAFETYERLERCRILTNFRKLPYSLGHGIRLGTTAAVRLGLNEDDVPELAELIAEIRDREPTHELVLRARQFNEMIWSRA